MGDYPNNKKSLTERFFDKNLSKKDRKTLDEKLRQEKGFAEDLAFRIALKKSLEEKKESRLRGYLSGKKERTEQKRTIRYLLRAAAVAVVLIGLFALLQKFNNKSFSTNVAKNELAMIQAEFAEKEPNLGEEDWMEYLGKGDFSQALVAMKAKRTTYKDPCSEDAPLNYYGARLLLFYAYEEKTAAIWLTCILENQNFVQDFPAAPAYGIYAYTLLGNIEGVDQILEKYPNIKNQYPHLFNGQ